MSKWKKTGHRGVRYYHHSARRHGAMLDKYFTIRFMDKVARKMREEGVGWASEGITEAIAFDYLKELKKAAKTGEGPGSLRDKRAHERKRRERDEIKLLTFGKFFDETYMPWTEANKAANSARTEKSIYNHWIAPALKNLPLAGISPVHIERIKKNMTDAGKSPKTIHHALAMIRQVYNFAKTRGLFAGDHPISKVKMPTVDNAKLRYLTPEEIEKLLSALQVRSVHVRDQAFLAVHVGLRFSEIAGLTWQDVNFESKTLSIRDSKTGSRVVFMNQAVGEMLHGRYTEGVRGFIFPDENGLRQAKASNTFMHVANDLFNQDVTDRRLRVSFHTLRHTFGSLLYQECGDLYLTGKALGHKTLVMAQRYAKMSETRLRLAFDTMSKVIENGKKKTAEVNERNPGKKEALKGI
jgi:integrase